MLSCCHLRRLYVIALVLLVDLVCKFISVTLLVSSLRHGVVLLQHVHVVDVLCETCFLDRRLHLSIAITLELVLNAFFSPSLKLVLLCLLS